jgi:rare lipoprotein A
MFTPMRTWRAILLLFLVLCLSFCTRIQQPPRGEILTGLASWYGEDFHGKTTSNREIYNMYDMTAAHKSLPFGTHVVVTNLENNKSVTVRINDRGPFVKGRIIDLSYAAARVLDMIGPGVVPVRVEILPDRSPPRSSQRFVVQVGAFSIRKNALELKDDLVRNHQGVFITTFKTGQRIYYRVRIKAVSLKDAEKICLSLQKNGYSPFVIEESGR